MPTTNSIQIRSRDAGMTIVLLWYSSARVAKIARWPWVVSPEPQWISLKAKEGGCHYLDESLMQGNQMGLTP